MTNSEPSTDKLEFESVNTHGSPVDLAGEPGNNPNLGSVPGQPVAVTNERVEKKIAKRPVGDSSTGKRDPDTLRQKVPSRKSV